MSYGTRFLAAVERARTAEATSVPVAVRRSEIIRLTVTGLTVPEIRALYVAHYSGTPMPRGLRKAEASERLVKAALAALATERAG
jgi:hypothetical protein